MKHKNINLILVLTILLSVFTNVFLIYTNQKLSKEVYQLQTDDTNSGNITYTLLSPDIAWLSNKEFSMTQKNSIINYNIMKQQLTNTITNSHGNYAIYFEDLNSGATIGINENEEFMPLSLLKVPTLIATLKEVESGSTSLETKIKLRAEDIDNRSGSLWKKGVGYEISVKDLLTQLITHSDNTAALTLNRRVVTDKTFFESRLAFGLPEPKLDESITPKEYVSMLRGLYFSNYLDRSYSELALSLMLETDFNSQLPAGIPENVKISHKVGFYNNEGMYHDCGIIYVPDNPYILCVMSKNTTSEQADKTISTISKIVYEQVTNSLVSVD